MAGQTLDRTVTGDGGELTLSQDDDRFAMRVDGMELMTSYSHRSEERLAVHGCAGLDKRPGARILIGGLGMGFTARAALDVLAPDAQVVVVEAVPAVVRWNQEILGHLAGHPLADPRLSILQADVVDVIAAADSQYDAILLDVDNGPKAFTTFTNKRLYRPEGLQSVQRALCPGGVLALWSTFRDATFTARLRSVGFDTSAKRVLAGDGTQRRHVIWLARRPAEGVAETAQRSSPA